MRDNPKRHFTMTVSREHLAALVVFARDHGYEGDVQEALRASSLMGLSADPPSVETIQRANYAYSKVRVWAMKRMSDEFRRLEVELQRALDSGQLDLSQLDGG